MKGSDLIPRVVLAAIITLVVLGAGLTKIADLDFWWQLRTGQLILAEQAVPRTDPFSFTAFGHEYVDHEWLFQVLLFGTWSLGGPLGIALIKSSIIAITLIGVALGAVQRGASFPVTGGLTLLAVAGGVTRMIERPELFSTLFAVVTFLLAESYVRTRDWRFLAVLPLLSALWANVHAAVVVGLIVQLFFVRSLPQVTALLVSAAASCANPFGFRVLTVPFELTRIIDSGLLNNEEWRHPSLAKVPFYFVALLLTAILLTLRIRREGVAGQTLPYLLVAGFLGYISLRYIRNVGLFCTFVPLLIGAEGSRLRRRWQWFIAGLGAFAAGIALTLYFPFQRGIGEASYFPDGLVRFVRVHALRGHMLNSYSFGGYLIWNLWPERPVFIDGRNEVYVALLERLREARTDSRAWNALLRDEKIEFALLDYVDDLDRVMTVDAAGRVTSSFAPLTATRFPRSRWALVEWDDDGMVFVRRDGANPILGEYDAVFPEGRGYQRRLVEGGLIDRRRAVEQIRAKLAAQPACHRARRLLEDLTQNR